MWLLLHMGAVMRLGDAEGCGLCGMLGPRANGLMLKIIEAGGDEGTEESMNIRTKMMNDANRPWPVAKSRSFYLNTYPM